MTSQRSISERRNRTCPLTLKKGTSCLATYRRIVRWPFFRYAARSSTVIRGSNSLRAIVVGRIVRSATAYPSYATFTFVRDYTNVSAKSQRSSMAGRIVRADRLRPVVEREIEQSTYREIEFSSGVNRTTLNQFVKEGKVPHEKTLNALEKWVRERGISLNAEDGVESRQRTELGRQIDEVLSGPYEPWEKVLLVAEVAAAHRAGIVEVFRDEVEVARIRAETIRAERINVREATRLAEKSMEALTVPVPGTVLPPEGDGGHVPPGG